MVMILFVLMDMRMLDDVNNDESMNNCAFINIIAYEKVIMLITTPQEWRRSPILEEDGLESEYCRECSLMLYQYTRKEVHVDM